MKDNNVLEKVSLDDRPRQVVLDVPAAPAATVQPLAFSELAHQPAANAPLALPQLAGDPRQSVHPLHQIRTKVTVCVGMAELTVGELLSAKEQQVLRLDRGVDHPVDVLVEGQVVARGTLVAVDDCFGVCITELPRPLAP